MGLNKWSSPLTVYLDKKGLNPLRNFNYLKLSRLICTSYVSSKIIGEQLLLFDDYEETLRKGRGYVIGIKEALPMANGRGVSDLDIECFLQGKNRKVKRNIKGVMELLEFQLLF